VNLGGLLAVAGLDHCPPDLVLGIFLGVAARVPHLSEERYADLCARGQARLEERAA
jgi:conjugative transfer protein TraD